MSYSPAGKEVLIEQLREVFVARGYDGATLAHLARATTLSKASLYHHFPGGKPEMASTLVRHAIADLQGQAFISLSLDETAGERVLAFINGFVSYTQAGARDCLLAVLNHHNTASEETAPLQSAIAHQFDDWHATLADVYVESGSKSKKADHEAHDLIAELYGALLTAKMHNQTALFKQAVKRIKKRQKRRFGQSDPS